ncbi:hypothetical protein B0A49_11562 [Cryomyces minteri]|uniref:Mannan endo-1,6-alpha-mannosidase n=1 Tax=Cryomyces minteri TaxID=331657 RepID=A0A4U0VUR0_9PEZI|nr:hypothetical protein B0A49_11562 [Cryomyces minteri]
MRSFPSASSAVCALLLSANCVSAITLDVTSAASIKSAASTIAHGMMQYYTGNQTGQVPGNLPLPYYWWEAGAMFGSLVDYWYYTGDTTYNDVTTQALLFQVGPDNNYMPPNQTKTEGNDDQAFWGLAALSAAELNYPNPPSDKPQWLALAQAVFNSQAIRWDNSTCGGGLRWQIYSFNNGYNYKNSISNGCFFNMAARLGKYTGNTTYLDWADRMWNWCEAVGLKSPTYQFFDGTDDTINCTQLNHIQWSYNAGVFLLGAATMWNVTGSDLWYQRTMATLNATDVFFAPTVPNVMYEVACEPNGNCNVDQRSFKAYLARWMAATTKVAPFTTDFVMAKLKASAIAAAQQCSGGADGVTCGLQWTKGPAYDGSYGVGEQMSALEVIQSNLIQQVTGPLTNSTGGTSKGNPSAGTGGDGNPAAPASTIKTGDKAGAGFLTAIILIGILGGAWWMVA